MAPPSPPSPSTGNAEQPALQPPARPEGQRGFGSTLLGGSIWMIAARWSMRMIGLVSTMILARLLLPEDFGLIAMALLVYGLLETISYAGVDLALMRQGAESRAHFDTAWTIQILQGIFITVCLVIAAPLVAVYFGEPRAATVMYWVAVKPVIDALQNIGVVAFRKELDFAKEFRYSLYNKAINFLVVVGLAVWLRNYWALVIGSIVASVLSLVLSYAMHPYRPRLSLAKIGEIWNFSQWLMISRIGSYLNRKCDEFVVGGHAGTASMGSYHVANELATLPTSEVVMPVRRAMFPALTRIADKPAEFAAAMLSSFSALAAICLFIGASLLVTAPEVVAVVLGGKWSDAVPLMRWMAIFGAMSALTLALEVPLWVAGKTDLSAAQSWVELALIVPVAVLAVRAYGPQGAAAARAGVALAMVPLMMVFAARLGQVTFIDLLRAMWRPFAAAAGMAALVGLAWPLDIAWPLLSLAAKGVACVLLYPALLLGLWRLAGSPAGAEADAITQWRRLLSVHRPGRMGSTGG